MKLKELEAKIALLGKRVEELEARPVYPIIYPIQILPYPFQPYTYPHIWYGTSTVKTDCVNCTTTRYSDHATPT